MSLFILQYANAKTKTSTPLKPIKGTDKYGNPIYKTDKSGVLDYSKKKCADLNLSIDSFDLSAFQDDRC